MKRPAYWNHNTVYYDWIKTQTMGCRSILDVGCGNGSLVHFLADGKKEITDIDPDSRCINKAKETIASNVSFLCGRFEDFMPQRKYDAVLFVASIHHMDMCKAIERAKHLLSSKGRLLIVGLSHPSTITDWSIEVLRVVPSLVLSSFHSMQASEKENIPVSYCFPSMNDVRTVASEKLPGFCIVYGLYYRYLLKWIRT